MKESAENYLETILLLSKRQGQVRSIDVANETGYAKPSISEAMKKLKAKELIEIDSGGFITFTEMGRQKAEAILERHEVLKQALIKLGVPEEIAEEDACKIEHNLNEVSFKKIKEFFNKGKQN